jgi:hypothetical protein
MPLQVLVCRLHRTGTDHDEHCGPQPRHVPLAARDLAGDFELAHPDYKPDHGTDYGTDHDYTVTNVDWCGAALRPMRRHWLDWPHGLRFAVHVQGRLRTVLLPGEPENDDGSVLANKTCSACELRAACRILSGFCA